MMIRPTLRSPHYLPTGRPQLPLTLIISDQGTDFSQTHPALLATAVAAVGRGLIYNCLSAEYGRGLQFWVDYNRPGSHSCTDALMLQFEEAFEATVNVLNEWSDYLSIYSDLDHALVFLRRYDPLDRSFVLSICDG